MKKLLLSLALALGLGIFSLAPIVNAQQAQVREGVCIASDDPTACATGTGADTTINNIVRTVVRILQVVAGIVAVIMIVIAGLRYTLSGGDAGKVSSAKNAIVYALVGIVVVIIAQALIMFVFNRIDQTNATPPTPPATTPAP